MQDLTARVLKLARLKLVYVRVLYRHNLLYECSKFTDISFREIA